MNKVFFSSLIRNCLAPYFTVKDLSRVVAVSKQFYETYNTSDVWRNAYLAPTNLEKYFLKATVESYCDSLQDDLKSLHEMMKMIKRNAIRDKTPDSYTEEKEKKYGYNDFEDNDVNVPGNIENKPGYVVKELMLKEKELKEFEFLYLGAFTDEETVEHGLEFVRDGLVNLKYLDAGSYGYEENELSWVGSENYTKILEWFPKLKYAYFKNGEAQSEMEPNHEYPNLLYFGIESCGICKELLNGVLGCKFPNLIELELWIGCEDRGNDSSVDDFDNLFECICCPKLKILRLRNSDLIIERILPKLLESKLMRQLKVLDFSFGIVIDSMMEQLLKILEFDNIKALLLVDSYLSQENVELIINKGKELGKEVIANRSDNADDMEEDDEYYVTVGE